MVNGFVREGVLHDEEIARIIPEQIKLIKEALASEDTLVDACFEMIIKLKDKNGIFN